MRQFIGLILLASLPLAASAQISFNFTYLDSGTGFNDPTTGATRRGALESAASMLASYFSSSPAYTVNMTVDTSVFTGTGFLASAGSLTFISNGTFQQGLVQQMILTGNDYSQSSLGTVKWNFGYTWDYDDSVAGGTFDFKAVAIHELTHALGFSSYITAAGTGLGSGGSGTGTTWSWFDQFLTDSLGNRLVTAGGVFNGGTLLTNGISSDVYFNGANAVAANGGNLVHIYSPATFEPGSSMSHLDTAFYTSDNFVMEHAVAAGAATRTLSAIEIGMLTDLGYFAPIPEPATVALWFGVAVLGLSGWRRRRAA